MGPARARGLPPISIAATSRGGGEEEEKQDMMADVRAPLGGDRGEGGSGKQAGGFGGPTCQMGWWFEQASRERRRWFGGLSELGCGQTGIEVFPNYYHP
jgi:hypothetical protein